MVLWLGFFFVVLAALLGSVSQKLSRTRLKLARVERKVDRIADQLGIADLEPELDQVDALLRQGKKIQAIKVYREITGADLVEAKAKVEQRAGQV